MTTFLINCSISFYHYSFVLLIAAHRLHDFYIDIGSNSDGSSAKQCAYEMFPFSESETRVYACPPRMVGRYVRIRFSEDRREHLQLCEVQIQGKGKILRYFVLQR